MAKAFRDVRAEGKNPPREQPGNAAVIRAALTSDTARSQAARQANRLLPAGCRHGAWWARCWPNMTSGPRPAATSPSPTLPETNMPRPTAPDWEQFHPP